MEYDSRPVRRIGTTLIALTSIAFLLPYAAILIHSFGTIWAYDWLPAAFTVKNYQEVLHDTGPIRNTLILISTVTPMIIFLGIVLGYMFKNQRKLRFFNYLTLLPFVLPGVVIGVGLIQTYSTVRIFGHDLMGSVVILIIAIGVRRLPFVLKTIETGFAKIDPSQRDAALSLGSGDIHAFATVIFPQIRPAVYSAVVIGIVKIVTELSASLIIYPPAWQNMSLYIAYYVDEGFISRAASMGIILILIVGACTAISNSLSRKDEQRT
jgi:iron(III) transport system permease protein